MTDRTETFEIRVVPAGDESPALVEVNGELDLSAARSFNDRLDDLLASGEKALHVDGSGLTFIDSSGLHALLEVKRQCDLRGVAFRIVGASATMRRLVDLTHTEELLPGV